MINTSPRTADDCLQHPPAVLFALERQGWIQLGWDEQGPGQASFP